MKLVTSPFSFRGKGYLGTIYRPYLKVSITTNRIDEWIPIEMVVDTGADYTLFSKEYAQLLGMHPEKECRREKTYGVGGEEKIYLCKRLVKMKIGTFERIIPVGFLDRNDMPPLLGRLDCLEIVTLIMKKRITTLEM